MPQAFFHMCGKWPLEIERLNNFVNEGTILVAVPLSIRANMLSGLVALDVSEFSRKNFISSVLQNNKSLFSSIKPTSSEHVSESGG